MIVLLLAPGITLDDGVDDYSMWAGTFRAQRKPKEGTLQKLGKAPWMRELVFEPTRRWGVRIHQSLGTRGQGCRREGMAGSEHGSEHVQGPRPKPG